MSAALRRLVYQRASGLCEYCLIHDDDTFFGCEIDHILSEKHGGLTVSENLALSCFGCNRAKGSDIASVMPGTDRLVRFYNPRTDHWAQHFRLGVDGIWIIPVTGIGEATARVFGFNDTGRLQEREVLREAGRYPPQEARTLLLDEG